MSYNNNPIVVLEKNTWKSNGNSVNIILKVREQDHGTGTSLGCFTHHVNMNIHIWIWIWKRQQLHIQNKLMDNCQLSVRSTNETNICICANTVCHTLQKKDYTHDVNVQTMFLGDSTSAYKQKKISTFFYWIKKQETPLKTSVTDTE